MIFIRCHIFPVVNNVDMTDSPISQPQFYSCKQESALACFSFNSASFCLSPGGGLFSGDKRCRQLFSPHLSSAFQSTPVGSSPWHTHWLGKHLEIPVWCWKRKVSVGGRGTSCTFTAWRRLVRASGNSLFDQEAKNIKEVKKEISVEFVKTEHQHWTPLGSPN